MKEQDKDMKG